MKKAPLLFFLSIVVVFSSAFSLGAWKDSVYELIKAETVKGLKANLNWEVSAASVEGPIVGQVVFRDVKIGDFAAAHKVTVEYRLLSFIWRRDIVPAISRITVEEGNFRAQREAGKEWNVFSLLPPVDPKAPPPPLFRPIIYFRNCSVTYFDHPGWHQGGGNFTETFSGVNGSINFQKKNRLSFDLTAQRSTVKSSGWFNFSDSKFSVLVKAQKIAAARWLNYIFPLTDYRLSGGAADLNLKLSPAKTKGWPLSLAGALEVADLRAEAAGLPVGQISGALDFTENSLAIRRFSANVSGIPVKLTGSLSDFSTLNCDADLDVLAGQVTVTGRDRKLELKADRLKAYQGEFGGNCSIDLNQTGAQLSLEAAFAKVALDQLAPNFSSTSGRISGRFLLGGPLNKLKGTLKADSQDAVLAGQSLSSLFVGLNLTDQGLGYNARLNGTGFLGTSAGTFNLERGFLQLDGLSLEASQESFSASGRLSWPLFAGQTYLAAKLKLPGSDLALNYYAEPKKLSGDIRGTLDFKDLAKYIPHYGSLAGNLSLDLKLDGTPKKPEANASFWLRDCRFNTLDFDLIKGGFALAGPALTIKDNNKILVDRGEDRYEISGQAKLDKPSFDLEIRVIKAELGNLFSLGERVLGELSRLVPSQTSARVRLDLAQLSLGLPAKIDPQVLYDIENPKKSALANWPYLKKAAAAVEAQLPQQLFSGQVSGDLSLAGTPAVLTGKFDATVNDGAFRNYKFDRLTAAGKIDQEKVRFDRFTLNKGPGRLSSAGSINFDGRLGLWLAARELPLDILQLLFDRDFKGTFNLSATVDGKYRDPNFVAQANSRNANLGGTSFDAIDLKVNKRGSRLIFDNCALTQNAKVSSINGVLPLDRRGEISLSAHFKDNALGLINLLTDQIAWRSGQAELTIEASGPLAKPVLTGGLTVKNSTVFVKALDSEIKKVSGQAVFTGHKIALQEVTGSWRGEKTKDYENRLGLSGGLTFDQAWSAVNLDLNLSPGSFYLNFPALFSGAVRVDSVRLTGPLAFDLAASQPGPTLSGQIEVNNALITLAEKSGDDKPFPLNFDLRFNLNKNVYAAMGDVSTLDLSSILMNLELGSEDLAVTGSLAEPSLHGAIQLKRGTITLFNREFFLLSADAQKSYYPYDSSKINDNTAFFAGETGPEGTSPRIDITAKVDVDDQVLGPDGQPVYKRVTILSRLQGKLGATDPLTGLRVNFSSFVEDKSKVPAEYRPGSYSDQEIKVLLLPDFIKSITGVNKGQESGVNSNAVVADYLASRVQTYVFRGLERDLEQKLGLESLTLDYNFGKDIRSAMGVGDSRMAVEQRPDWRVGFVKGFFDRLYVDVKYFQYAGETSAQAAAFNYQLTYKLSPIWAIMYYREPMSLQDLNSGYSKVTLKAGFSFW